MTFYCNLLLIYKVFVIQTVQDDLGRTAITGKNESDRIASLNSLSAKKQTTKFTSAIFQKMLSQSYIILRIKRLECVCGGVGGGGGGGANSVDRNEVAHYEPPHHDLHTVCKFIYLF